MTLYEAFRTAAHGQSRVLLLGLLCAAIYAALVHTAVPARGDVIIADYHHSTNLPGATTLPSTVIGRGEQLR